MKQGVRLMEVVCTAKPTARVNMLVSSVKVNIWHKSIFHYSYLISSSGPSLYLAPWALAIEIPKHRRGRRKKMLVLKDF